MLDAKKFGLAAGILWGAAMLVFTLISIATGYADEFMSLMANVYPGYTVSVEGSVIGLIYGFLDGFIGCYLFAAIYNKLHG
ncbi:MAG: bacteriophage holin [Patescibacteria group bacterium]|nr:bacteriophage holin [Patescibacteria group bacterium]